MSTKVSNGEIKQKNLSVISFCLFSAWNLSFLFEGQVLYSIIESAQIDGTAPALVKAAVLTVFIGLFTSGFLVKKQVAAKVTMIISIFVCIAGSLIFYLPFSILWYISIISIAYFSSLSCKLGFYFKTNFILEERLKQSRLLIYPNVLILLLMHDCKHS